jgi:hypothetical protein
MLEELNSSSINGDLVIALFEAATQRHEDITSRLVQAMLTAAEKHQILPRLELICKQLSSKVFDEVVIELAVASVKIPSEGIAAVVLERLPSDIQTLSSLSSALIDLPDSPELFVILQRVFSVVNQLDIPSLSSNILRRIIRSLHKSVSLEVFKSLLAKNPYLTLIEFFRYSAESAASREISELILRQCWSIINPTEFTAAIKSSGIDEVSEMRAFITRLIFSSGGAAHIRKEVYTLRDFFVSHLPSQIIFLLYVGESEAALNRVEALTAAELNDAEIGGLGEASRLLDSVSFASFRLRLAHDSHARKCLKLLMLFAPECPELRAIQRKLILSGN